MMRHILGLAFSIVTAFASSSAMAWQSRELPLTCVAGGEVWTQNVGGPPSTGLAFALDGLTLRYPERGYDCPNGFPLYRVFTINEGEALNDPFFLDAFHPVRKRPYGERVLWVEKRLGTLTPERHLKILRRYNWPADTLYPAMLDALRRTVAAKTPDSYTKRLQRANYMQQIAFLIVRTEQGTHEEARSWLSKARNALDVLAQEEADGPYQPSLTADFLNLDLMTLCLDALDDAREDLCQQTGVYGFSDTLVSCLLRPENARLCHQIGLYRENREALVKRVNELREEWPELREKLDQFITSRFIDRNAVQCVANDRAHALAVCGKTV